MKIFLSYASEDREQAKSIYLPLHEQGHRVFFDRSDLPAGEEYHNRIRKAIEASDLFVMLVSPYAIDNGSYTLTELDIAERAGARLLPVMLRKPDVESLPAAIKAVTFLETDGSLPGAVAAEVHRISRELSRRRRRYAIAALAVVAAVSIAAFYATKSRLWNAETGKDGAPPISHQSRAVEAEKEIRDRGARSGRRRLDRGFLRDQVATLECRDRQGRGTDGPDSGGPVHHGRRQGFAAPADLRGCVPHGQVRGHGGALCHVPAEHRQHEAAGRMGHRGCQAAGRAPGCRGRLAGRRQLLPVGREAAAYGGRMGEGGARWRRAQVSLGQ